MGAEHRPGRKRVKGHMRMPPKSMKVAVEATIRHFYPSLSPLRLNSKRTQIYKWRKDKEALKAVLSSGKGSLKKQRAKGFGTSLSKEAELDLVVWVNDLRSEGIPISRLMLKLKAFEIAAEYGQQGFAASWNWQKLFRQRHKLGLRADTGQGDFQQIAVDFAAKIDEIFHDKGITKIYHADQLQLSLSISKKTVNVKVEETVWVRCDGMEKERATVMLLGDEDGVKYAPFVIFKANKSKN
uniref:Uncharacterized protein AlNc14C1G179 n=1 Tax=Albugo laibachii Nc14 TaxID=890382 RepID=F0VZ38_9STRA|nr:conserved hypothetical protein [Albugo laibachii Nc14]|eukprot:CCA14053.1 conserved hypothetical protein [Albugo laibachii Nc14]